MTAPILITQGQKFGDWAFMEFAPNRGDKRVARCQCRCGTIQDVYLTHLRTGKSTKCKRCYIVKHDMSGTPTYTTWRSMISRCYNKQSKNFKHYGARGITVCDAWRTFEGFFADMGERPEGMTLDRIDVNGGYRPANCRWATLVQQANNTRANKHIEYGGRTHTQAELARHLGIDPKTLRSRLRRGGQVDAPLHPGVAG